MGAGLCSEEKAREGDPAALETHRRIEMEIKQTEFEDRRVIKVLLLGAADSGKSTIAKQMRILHSDGFNETELINYRYLIHTNFLTCYAYIAKGIHQLGIPIADDVERELVNKFLNSCSTFFDYDDEDQIKVIKDIGACTCVQEACKRLSEFYVPDNTSYLFSQAPRILHTQYKPTEIDVIHARASTTGVHEIMFAFRRFNITVLFVAALSCFDQFMEEDPTKNRMDDSVELFQKMYSNEFLCHASFILFLNKKDLFEEKLEYVELSKFFPNYEKTNEYEHALEFIRQLFIRCQQKSANGVRQIYCHMTNATDRKNISFVFGAACDIILQSNLSRAGMT